MANFQKFTRGSIDKLFAHYDRTLSNNSNKEIESSKSSQNYNLAPHSENQNEFLKKRLSEVRVLNRADVNVLGSWIVTLPKDFDGDQKDFFQATYDFLREKYGEKNVVSAFVHLDETQPHLHFAFVPVVTDKKKGVEKVSAKECVGKLELQKFHPELQDYLSRKLGQEVHILNGATQEGNSTIRELKSRTKERELHVAAEDFLRAKEAAAAFLKEHEAGERPLSELGKVSNIGTAERLEKNFPLQKSGTFTKESAYEYADRHTKKLWGWFKAKFYDPLKDRYNELLGICRTLKTENERLQRQNRALDKSADKIVAERLESRTQGLLVRLRAEFEPSLRELEKVRRENAELKRHDIRKKTTAELRRVISSRDHGIER